MTTVKAKTGLGVFTRAPKLGALSARLGIPGWLAIAVIVVYAVIALLGSWLAPYDPTFVSLSDVNRGISVEHWFGTNSVGADLLSKILVGARTTLVAPLVIVASATILGTTLAFVSGWNGGWIDSIISRYFDVTFAFPSLLLAILVVALISPGLTAASIALVFAYIPYVGRFVRSAVMREKSQPYITNLKLLGFGGPAICYRHVLPNVFGLISSQALIAFGYAMVDLAAISFIGLGVQPPQADWGLMVAAGQVGITNGYPMESVLPALLIAAGVAATNVLGDRLGVSASD